MFTHFFSFFRDYFILFNQRLIEFSYCRYLIFVCRLRGTYLLGVNLPVIRARGFLGRRDSRLLLSFKLGGTSRPLPFFFAYYSAKSAPRTAHIARAEPYACCFNRSRH